MLRRLTPWFENLGKRQVKSPKLYFRDSGILLALLGIAKHEELQTYPKLGSFWEGFALEEVTTLKQAQGDECYFWATQGGAELDLLILKEGKRWGYEFKYTDHPKITKSMEIARGDLKLDHLTLVFPGKESFPLAEGITAVGLDAINEER